MLGNGSAIRERGRRRACAPRRGRWIRRRAPWPAWRASATPARWSGRRWRQARGRAEKLGRERQARPAAGLRGRGRNAAVVVALPRAVMGCGWRPFRRRGQRRAASTSGPSARCLLPRAARQSRTRPSSLAHRPACRERCRCARAAQLGARGARGSGTSRDGTTESEGKTTPSDSDPPGTTESTVPHDALCHSAPNHVCPFRHCACPGARQFRAGGNHHSEGVAEVASNRRIRLQVER